MQPLLTRVGMVVTVTEELVTGLVESTERLERRPGIPGSPDCGLCVVIQSKSSVDCDFAGHEFHSSEVNHSFGRGVSEQRLIAVSENQRVEMNGQRVLRRAVDEPLTDAPCAKFAECGLCLLKLASPPELLESLDCCCLLIGHVVSGQFDVVAINLG